MPFAAIPIFILIAAAIIALIIAAEAAARRRREALAALAAELGWRFYPDRDKSHDEEYAHFEFFRRGHSRVAFNTLAGSIAIDGREYWAKAGDFRYLVTRHNGKTTQTDTYTFSYLIVHTPFGRRLPMLLIRPEGIFDKMAGAFGFDDIDFESVEFSKRFYVRSDDKRMAYDVIDPRMMEFLLKSNPPAVDIEHGQCLVSDGARQWTPEQFRWHLRWVVEFFDHFPDHVTVSLDAR